VLFFLISFSACFSYNSLDTNWRNFWADKQYWDIGCINKLWVDDEYFFVVGTFGARKADSVWFNCIAELRDTVWVPLGTGYSAGIRSGLWPFCRIWDLVRKDSLLYVGGFFDFAGTSRAYGLAVFNLNRRTWSEVGGRV